MPGFTFFFVGPNYHYTSSGGQQFEVSFWESKFFNYLPGPDQITACKCTRQHV